MKRIKVSYPSGFRIFENLFSTYLYDVNEDLHLLVYKRDETTGSEKLLAHYKTWDYFEIDDE